MKRFFSLMLCVVMIVSVLCISIPSSAAGDTLTINVPGLDPVTVKVGQTVLFTTYLTVGPDKIVDGQGYTNYDADMLQYVVYGLPDNQGKPDYELYSFPKIYKANLVSNVSEKNYFHFNFYSVKGATTFNTAGQVADSVLCRFRFKAIAPGTTTISTSVQYMSNLYQLSEDDDPQYQNVYYRGEPNPQNHPNINPVMTYSLEKPAYVIGDADADDLVTIKDATQIQKIFAGKNIPYSTALADANADSKITLKDAVEIRAYLAGSAVSSPVGTSVFASEQ